MKKIKIFLASSIKLKNDREAFEIKINRKNKSIADKGIFIHLDIFEEFSTQISPTRSQDEYNKIIKESCIFILLAHSKVGRYSNEEFDTAYSSFMKNKRPLVFTYFKKIQSNFEESLPEFKKKLDNLGHFYPSYTNIDNLWNQFENEIDKYIVNTQFTINNKFRKMNDHKVVLFNNYTSNCEPYYIERDSDTTFNKLLSIDNVWVYGRSGAGKTALIHRNLIQERIDFCFCDLSPVTIKSPNNVFEEILTTIEVKFKINRDKNENNILKQITKILCHNHIQKIIIVIDELATINHELLKEIAESFIKLVNYYSNNVTQSKLSFVVSTISNPNTIIENKPKAREYFQFMCCDNWNPYISQLFDRLSSSLGLNIETYKTLIIEQSNNSPRTLKFILKKLIIEKVINKKSIDKIIITTLSELV